MAHTIKATFAVTDWQEEAYLELSKTAKLTRATSMRTYSGAIEGSGRIDYLMAYEGDRATFVGLEHIEGALDGHRGSFVLRHEGTWDAGEAHSKYSVIEGSGTGALRSLSGKGRATATADQTPLDLEYTLA